MTYWGGEGAGRIHSPSALPAASSLAFREHILSLNRPIRPSPTSFPEELPEGPANARAAGCPLETSSAMSGSGDGYTEPGYRHPQCFICLKECPDFSFAVTRHCCQPRELLFGASLQASSTLAASFSIKEYNVYLLPGAP